MGFPTFPTPAADCVSNSKKQANQAERLSGVITTKSMINRTVGKRARWLPVLSLIAVRATSKQQLRDLANCRDVDKAARGDNPLAVRGASAEIANFKEVKPIRGPH